MGKQQGKSKEQFVEDICRAWGIVQGRWGSMEELADLDFVGMDCVEVAPAYDHAELTANAAAGFVWTYLCGRLARRAALAMQGG